MDKDLYRYITSHNLVNRIYDMVFYFGLIKNPENESNIKKFFKVSLKDIEYVESLAKYFDNKMRYSKKNIELWCNLRDLVYDLDYVKQYLAK